MRVYIATASLGPSIADDQAMAREYRYVGVPETHSSLLRPVVIGPGSGSIYAQFLI
jgi:hypothetical protein